MIGRMKFEIDALVDEILDRLPEEVWASSTTTFLDPAIGGGQFVRSIESRLRKAGHSDDNISQRVFGFENSKLNIRYAVKKHGLLGQYFNVAYDDFFEKGINMKFDVVVGNPPYNPPAKEDRSGSGNKIWQKFIEKAFDSLAEDGIVAMVTPTTWRHGNFNKNRLHKRAQELIFTHGVSDWADAKKHFPMIGHSIGIDWWISKKGSDINIETNPTMLLTRNNDQSMLLLEEWLNNLKCDVVFNHDIKENRSYDYSRTRGANAIDDTHVYPHLITGSKTKNGIYDWYDTKTNGFDRKKVIVFVSSGPNPFYDSKGEWGCGHSAYAYSVENDEEAQEIIDFFGSKLCNWLVLQVAEKNAMTFPTFLFKRIPKNWRELEEKHFG